MKIATAIPPAVAPALLATEADNHSTNPVARPTVKKITPRRKPAIFHAPSKAPVRWFWFGFLGGSSFTVFALGEDMTGRKDDECEKR